jgi:uncharacterized protein YjbI with pentapeptide repeats
LSDRPSVKLSPIDTMRMAPIMLSPGSLRVRCAPYSGGVKPSDVQAPRSFPVEFGPLAVADALDLDEGPRLEDRDFSGVDFGSRELLDVVFSGCNLTGAVVTGADLRGVELMGSRVADLNATIVHAPDSVWRRSELGGSRIGAGELFGSRWEGSAIRTCKFGYLNLRGARLVDVSFTECRFDDLDLLDATLERVAFTDCIVGNLTLRGATLSHVDLRGLRIDGIDGVAGLAGATISHDQLLDLAPALASHLGLSVDT